MWFPERDRTKIINIMSFFVSSSFTLGNLISSIFFFGTDKDDADITYKRFSYILYMEAGITVISSLSLIIFLKPRP